MWRRLRESWWFVPSLCTAIAIGLSFGVEAVDRHIGQYHAWYLFGGGPEGARSVLSVVAESVLTFSGIVFSLTVLALQLASSQFSPRVLKTFLRDLGSQLSFGIFVGTFVYALSGLRAVIGTAQTSSHVPSLTVWLAVILAIACVAMFIYYINHMAQSIRAIVVIRRIGEQTRTSLEQLYPEGIGADPSELPDRRPPGEASLTIPWRGKPGVLQEIDGNKLESLAIKANVSLAGIPEVGDYVTSDAPLLLVWGDAAKLDVRRVTRCFSVGSERTIAQDPAFGIRQLVDIAERALSPAMNDPTTAKQAIDEIHSILALMVRRRFPASYRLDDQGVMRLVLPRPNFADHLHLAVDEIKHYGRDSARIMARLRGMLLDLLRVAPPFRRPILYEVVLSLPEMPDDRRGEPWRPQPTH